MLLEAYMQGQSSELKVIHATAGAGKTQTLVNEVINSIYTYYQKHQSFPRTAIATFSRKATSEMKERLIIEAINKQDKKLIEYISYSPKLQISTIHGILYRFLQMHSAQAGLSPGFAISNERQSDQLFVSALKEELFKNKTGTSLLEHYTFNELKKVVKDYILYKQEHPQARPFNLQEIKKAIREKELIGTTQKDILEKCNLTNQYLFIQLSLELQSLGDIVLNSWELKKKSVSQITLSDLEIMVLDLIRSKKINTDMLKNHWNYWFVDEYQDTSIVQDQILDVLTEGSQLFIVGDPQQSIYRFRKANPSVFLRKKDIAKQKGSKYLQYHTNNYRSDPELVTFFNDFFKDVENMNPQRSDLNPNKIVARFIHTVPNSPKSNTREHILELQFKQTANYLKQLISQEVQLKNVAILSRNNSVINGLARYLKTKKISIRLHSTGQFTNRREIKDALFLLRFLCNPHHNENLVGLLRSPYWRVPDDTLVKWARNIGYHYNSLKVKQSLWEICLSQQKAFPVISILNDYLLDAARKGIVHSFQIAIETSGLMDLSYYQDPTGLVEANLWKLIYQLKQHEYMAVKDGMTGVENSEGYMEIREGYWISFVDHLLEMEQEDVSDSTRSAVSAIASSGVELMTVHAAKGLQFDHVILLDVYRACTTRKGKEYFAGESFPNSRWSICIKGEDEKRIMPIVQDNIFEERKKEELKEGDRLLYVALTRARKTVTLISAGTKPGSNSWANRLEFLKHLYSSKKIGLQRTNHYTYSVEVHSV